MHWSLFVVEHFLHNVTQFLKFEKLKKEAFLRIGIKEAYTAHTLTVCSFLRTRCWDKIMSCVLRRNHPSQR